VKREVASGTALLAVLAATATAATEQVTLSARPSTLGPSGRVFVSGAVDSRRAGDVVTIQAKDCQAVPNVFRDVAEARTEQSGAWSTEYAPGIGTTLRAVWRDQESAPVAIRQRANVSLRQLASGRLWAGVVAKTQFWRKHVLIQRFNRRLGTWSTVRSVVLTETVAGAPGAASFVWSYAEFRLRVPKGTLLRAFFPLSQARPCYLGAASTLVRTRT
jgi:hypothetical protein